jgi:hypothetical protein
MLRSAFRITRIFTHNLWITALEEEIKMMRIHLRVTSVFWNYKCFVGICTCFIFGLMFQPLSYWSSLTGGQRNVQTKLVTWRINYTRQNGKCFRNLVENICITKSNDVVIIRLYSKIKSDVQIAKGTWSSNEFLINVRVINGHILLRSFLK